MVYDYVNENRRFLENATKSSGTAKKHSSRRFLGNSSRRVIAEWRLSPFSGAVTSLSLSLNSFFTRIRHDRDTITDSDVKRNGFFPLLTDSVLVAGMFEFARFSSTPRRTTRGFRWGTLNNGSSSSLSDFEQDCFRPKNKPIWWPVQSWSYNGCLMCLFSTVLQSNVLSIVARSILVWSTTHTE